MVGPAAKRQAVAHLRSVLEISERRACTIVSADRKIDLPPLKWSSLKYGFDHGGYDGEEEAHS